MTHLAPTPRKPVKLVAAALLVTAALVVAVIALVRLGGGDTGSTGNGAAARPPAASKPAPSATTPSLGIDPTATSRVSSSPVARQSSVRPAPAATTAPVATRKPLTYVVKRGDNLTVIADWFKLHGYGDLYERNRKVIGRDPDLIRPGQRITISSAGVATSR